MQVLLPPGLQAVEFEHGDGTKAATAMRKIVRETLPTKATIAGLDHRKPEGLGTADASAVVIVCEENRRGNTEDAQLEVGIGERHDPQSSPRARQILFRRRGEIVRARGHLWNVPAE